jgi:hypothetical protein
MALESKVEGLDGRRKGGQLFHQIQTDLGVPGGLVNMCADKEESH